MRGTPGAGAPKRLSAQAAAGPPHRAAAIRYDYDGDEIGQDAEEITHEETAPGRHRFSALGGWGSELGYADVREKPGHVWLHNLYVHPDDRGRGTGGKLVDHVIAHFPGREIRLHPHPSPEGWEREEDLGPDEDVLRDFYGRHGFEDYHPGEGDPAGSFEHMVRYPMRSEAAARWQPSSGIFAPTTGLDRRLFDEHGRLRTAVHDAIMERLDRALREQARLVGDDWHEYLRVYLAGGSASEWAGSRPNEGAQDLDVLIGVDYPAARGRSPALAAMDDEQADASLNAALRGGFNETSVILPGVEGTWDLTGYVNHAAYDVRAIRPYAAYDVSGMSWAVRPPHLPAHTLKDFDPAVLAHARAVTSEARAILRMPEPLRTREARALWERIHAGRSQAFSPEGQGWQDPENVAEKWLAYAPGNLLGRVRELALARTASVAGPLYHGSMREIPPGTVLTPEGRDPEGSIHSGDWVYAASTPEAARYFGSMHDTSPMTDQDVFVHRVEPVGDLEPDEFPGEDERFARGNYKAKALRVLDSQRVPGHWAPKTAFLANVEAMGDGGFTFGHRPGSHFEPHEISARHPASPGDSILEPGEAGRIQWRPDNGEVVNVRVHDAFRRQGLGTELWNRARAIDPGIRHSDTLSDDARKWTPTLAALGSHVPEDEPVVRDRNDLGWGDEEWALARREPWHAAAKLAQQEVRMSHPRTTMEFPRGEGGDEMVGHILRRAGYPPELTEGAFVARHPRPEQRTSNPSWLNGKPGVALHPDRWDYGTVAHEAAHHVVMYNHAESPNEPSTDERVHGPEWAAAYGRALNAISRNAGDDFTYHHQRFRDIISEGLQVMRPRDLDDAEKRLPPSRWIREGTAVPTNKAGSLEREADAPTHVAAAAGDYAEAEYYHASPRKLPLGTILRPPGRGRGNWDQDQEGEHVYLTPHLDRAEQYHYELWEQGHKDPHVYQVHPHGKLEQDPNDEKGLRTKGPVEVIGHVFGHEPDDDEGDGPSWFYSGQHTAASGYQGLTKRSGMIYLDLPEGTVKRTEGGVDDHHITIVYLGKDVSDKAFEEACRRAREAAACSRPLSGFLRGVDAFEPSDSSDDKVPAFVPAYIPGVGELRRALEDLSASEHRQFRPHVTLGYYGEDEDLPGPHPTVPVRFDRLHVKRGEDIVSFPLGSMSREAAAERDWGPGTTIRMAQPEEYSKFEYPDYKAKTLPTLARHFERDNPAYWEKLRDDIRRNGVQAPILVRHKTDYARLKRPRVMDGHNRAAAAYSLGLPIPVGDYDNQADFDAGWERGRQWFSENQELKSRGTPPW